MKSFSIALAGNPNSGKTTLFNAMTGANQKVGNWGGVTVEVKEGKTRAAGTDMKIVDLPGTYSLTAYSEEELVARNYIAGGEPSLVVNVIDSTNLERNLYLSIQLLEMGVPALFAFNMSDEASAKGIEIDTDKLSKFFGVAIRRTTGRTGEGVKDLLDTAAHAVIGGAYCQTFRLDYGREIESKIDELTVALAAVEFDRKGISDRWYAVKLLENDPAVIETFMQNPAAKAVFDKLEEAGAELEKFYNDDVSTLICEKRYGFISGALKEAVTVVKTPDRKDVTDRIDKVLLNKWLAYPIFAAFMWAIFQLTFKLGQYPMNWIDTAFKALGDWVSSAMAPSLFRDLLTEGIISGIGSVIVFLPNILILFLGLSFLEDTGYMARIAFIMDKFMHKIGLHGKSFIPLIMGIGCSVPAIMAARTLESKKDRILTILVTPLITCSARLPVYVLFAGAFFPRHAGNVIFGIYVISFLVAFGMGFLFRKTLFRGEDMPFVMELPPYRLPTPRSVAIHMWEKAKHYLEKMGGVVLFFSIVIWMLGTFPLKRVHAVEAVYDARIAEATNASPVADEAALARLESEKHSAAMEATYIGGIGRFIAPVLAPVGFDWKMGVSLVTGFVAKEVVVSTMGVLYSAGESADESSEQLRQSLRQHYTPLQGFAFMIFVLLYTPCLVALTTIFKEMKSVKWSLFAVFYQLALAWLVSFAVYRVGLLFGL